MKLRHILGLLCAASLSVVLAGNASAQDKTVKIGGVFPLSGNAASAGVHAKAAIETALDIINNAHPELGNFPLAKNAGLAGLGGAKVEVVYAANATDVQSQVLQLKEKKPDVVIMITYTSDAILFAKTMQALDYKPPMLLADDAGYSDPSFIKAVGKLSVGAFNRSSWSVGP